MSWEEGSHGHPGPGICSNKTSACLHVCVHTPVCMWEHPALYTFLITIGCAAWVYHAPTARFTHGWARGDVSVRRANPMWIWAGMFV